MWCVAFRGQGHFHDGEGKCWQLIPVGFATGCVGWVWVEGQWTFCGWKVVPGRGVRTWQAEILNTEEARSWLLTCSHPLLQQNTGLWGGLAFVSLCHQHPGLSASALRCLSRCRDSSLRPVSSAVCWRLSSPTPLPFCSPRALGTLTFFSDWNHNPKFHNFGHKGLFIVHTMKYLTSYVFLKLRFFYGYF